MGKPLGMTVERAARKVPAPRLLDTERQLDMQTLRAYRLGRVKEKLRENGIALAVLNDPISVRYTTGYRNWSLFQTHVITYYLFVSPTGPTILYGYAEKESPLETIDEVRAGAPMSYFNSGPHWEDGARKFAADVTDYLKLYCDGDHKVGIERFSPSAALALLDRKAEIVDVSWVIEQARIIKSAEEILCMNYAMAVAEAGIARMREACRPGITEEALWAVLHEANISLGGEWIEARLLCAGDRTNPWGQEASSRLISAGELVAFDTDLVGPFGYCADVSRTLYCGPGRPTPHQRDIYKLALEELEHNLELIRPGVAFGDFSRRAFKVPDQFLANRYTCLAHGLGMCDEYPKIAHPLDWSRRGYDGVIQPGMVLCLESYIGEEGGFEGVKLEEQVVVTDTGYQRMSRFPFENEFLD